MKFQISNRNTQKPEDLIVRVSDNLKYWYAELSEFSVNNKITISTIELWTKIPTKNLMINPTFHP